MNIMQIMKQAQNVQAKLKATQEELSKMELVGEAGGGAVKIICDGQGKFKSIKLTSDAVNVDDEAREMLEDLITTAINNATAQATKEMQSKMNALTGGINIPGLF